MPLTMDYIENTEWIGKHQQQKKTASTRKIRENERQREKESGMNGMELALVEAQINQFSAN